MSRRLRRCLTCRPQTPDSRSPFAIPRGYTRHDDRVCAACRREGKTTHNTRLRVHLNVDTSAYVDALDDLTARLTRDTELRRFDHYPGRGGW